LLSPFPNSKAFCCHSGSSRAIFFSKQCKSGFSSVKEKTGLGGKNDPRKGRVAPIAQATETQQLFYADYPLITLTDVYWHT
jgi:hypothetical protein